MDEREGIIRSYLPLVRRIARRIHRLLANVDLDDLIGDGCVGLIRAVDTYDPTYGVPLEHYARKLILGKMLHGVRRMDRVSERTRRELRDADRERYVAASREGRLPTMAEMERRRPKLSAARAQAHVAQPLSLDSRLPDDYELPLDYNADPALIADRHYDRIALRALVASLPERKRQLILMYYFANKPMREIAAHWSVSSQRVSQLHTAAVRRLKELARVAAD